MSAKSRFRKQYIIQPQFQWKMILFSSLIMLGLSSIILTCSYLIFSSFSQELLTNPGLGQDQIKELISNKTSLFLMFSISSFVIAGLIVFSWSLVFSNKIAGPIYRLNLYFEDAARSIGKNKELSFRDGDYFEKLPESINAYLYQHDLIALEEEPPLFKVDKKAS